MKINSYPESRKVDMKEVVLGSHLPLTTAQVLA